MQTLGIIAVWVHLLPVLRRSTVLIILACLFVLHSVRYVVINVHTTRVRVTGQNIFIHLRDFLELVEELLLIHVVLVHQLLPLYDKFHILIPHSYEYWWSLDHEANVNPHVVCRHSIEYAGIDVEDLLILSLLRFLNPFFELKQIGTFFGQTVLLKFPIFEELRFHRFNVVKVPDILSCLELI